MQSVASKVCLEVLRTADLVCVVFPFIRSSVIGVVLTLILSSESGQADSDVTRPGDLLRGSSYNSPGSESVFNVIDDRPTKYVNYDQLNAGLIVTPHVGKTLLTGLTVTSANDAPERDPSSYYLAGSNDGTNYALISSGSLPGFPGRFVKVQVSFPSNAQDFSSYLLVFPTVAGPGADSMQLSEIELLGHQTGGVGNCMVETNGVLISRQPHTTSVLVGATATFRVELTGPWNVQWYRNGVAIPGATNETYTTPTASLADANIPFSVRVGPAKLGNVVGVCEASEEALLTLFIPSGTESIGLSWRGSTANGTPTSLLPDDVAGLHPQAFWNNLSGSIVAPVQLITSSNRLHPTITAGWNTSGEWGIGTGTRDPTERLLNGLGTCFGTSTNTAQTFTFQGVPSGRHTLIIYAVQVPLEFFQVDIVVVTHDLDGREVVERRYIRPLNVEEYSAFPGFWLATGTTPSQRQVGNVVRIDDVQPGPDGLVQIRFFSPDRVDLPGGGPPRGPGLNAMQLLLDPPATVSPPEITLQPVSNNLLVGHCVRLMVRADGTNLTYQWYKDNQAVPSATASHLSVREAGDYFVVISNAGGSLRSRTAVVQAISSGSMLAGAIAHLKLDDGGADGRTASNSISGGQAGQILGLLPNFSPGQVSGSMEFNGLDNYVEIADYPKVGKAMTVAGWIVPFSDNVSIINNWVDGQTTGSSGQFRLAMANADGQSYLQGMIEVGANRVLAQAPVDSDPFTLHHFAMIANGAELTLYWDGVLRATADYLGNINQTPGIPWLALGADLDSGGGLLNAPLVGRLDEIGLWSRSLSATEIGTLYQGGREGISIDQLPSRYDSGSPIHVVVVGGGYVLVTPDPKDDCAAESVRVIALPNSGWQFSHWEGDASGTRNPLQIDLTGYRTLYGYFTNFAGCAIASSGLVGWWPAAGNTRDMAGTNHGILDGATGIAPGKVGQAFVFDGVSADVLIPPSPSLKFSNAFTLEAWINPADVSNYRQIFSWMANAPDQSYQLGVAPNGALRMDISGNGVVYDALVSPNDALPANAWTHVAGTYAGGAMKLYVNGVQVAAKNSTVTSLYTGTSYNMYIGTTPLGTQRFAGLIDEMSAYSRALSGQEIQAIRAANNAGKCVTPVYITGVNRAENSLNLTWLAQSNWTYRVQYRTNLNAATPWINVNGDVIATGSSASKADALPANAEQRFYRVQLLR